MANCSYEHESHAPIQSDEDSHPLKPHWLCPASRLDDDDDDPASPPETVLLEKRSYIDGERNATTAAAARTNGTAIQVTFWIARPPRVSHLAVHCAGLEPETFQSLPRVVATEHDLALIHVPLSSEHLLGHDRPNEFFVYRAGAGDRPPLLRLIPNPSTRFYAQKEVGILSRIDDRFVIAVLHRDPFPCPPTRYVHLFDSESSARSTKKVHLESPTSCLHTSTSKVITMGGKRGSMGWVDLWHGILVYDVFPLRGANNVVRFIPLPSPPESALQGLAETVRDMVAVDGVIRYFAMYSPGAHTTNVVGEWHADAWKMKQPWKKWRHEFHLKASEITVDDERHSQLLRDLADDDGDGVQKKKKPVSMRLPAGSPVLSLQDDDIVYILTKPMYRDEKACVLAVDMRTKTLRGVDEFDAGRTVGFMFTYTQSGIFRGMLDFSSDDSEEEQWIDVSYKRQ